MYMKYKDFFGIDLFHINFFILHVYSQEGQVPTAIHDHLHIQVPCRTVKDSMTQLNHTLRITFKQLTSITTLRGAE